jgi:hypothetical protein
MRKSARIGVSPYAAGEFRDVDCGIVVERADAALLEGKANGNRSDRLGHRVREQPMLRRSFVLIAFDLHDAVLDHHQSGNAPPRQEIVDRATCVGIVGRGRGDGQRSRAVGAE